jgi:hypothetical protein
VLFIANLVEQVERGEDAPAYGQDAVAIRAPFEEQSTEGQEVLRNGGNISEYGLASRLDVV